MELSQLAKDRRQKPKGREDKPIAVWTEKEFVKGSEKKALVVVLSTKGCHWAWKGGCTMCGYVNDSAPKAGGEEILSQIEQSLKQADGATLAKLYTSGSFLDPREVPIETQRNIISILSDHGIDRVLIESRPEFVDKEHLKALGEKVKIELAIGLESSDDEILLKHINKGFVFEQYREAAKKAKSAGADIRTYLLMKPPYITEKRAMEDTLSSCNAATSTSDVISINPMNIQRGTAVELMWKKGQYRPPWLWSVVQVLLEAPSGPKYISSPTAGGKKRGAHNCGKCDKDVLRAIEKFSLNADKKALEAIMLEGCGCQKTWKDQMEYDKVLDIPSDINSWRNTTWV